MRLSASLGLTDRRSGVAAPFSVTITGLTSGEARPGDHASIGYTTDPVSATETVKWSDSSDPAAAATWGTGANPTDYTAADGVTLWLHVTDTIDGETFTVSRSAPIGFAVEDFASIWYDPDGTITSDAAGFVTSVDDKTTSNIDLSIASAGLKPSQGVPINGKNALWFSGQGNGLTADGNYMTAAWAPNDDFWVAMYVKRGPQVANGSSIRTFFATGSAEGAEVTFGTRSSNTSADSTICFSDGTNVTQSGAGTFSVGDEAVVFFQYSRTNFARVYLDGVLVVDDTTNVAAAPASLVVIGGSMNDVTRCINGGIGEIIAGNGVLGSGARDFIVSELESRWGGQGTTKSVAYAATTSTTYGPDKKASQGVAVDLANEFVFTSTPTPGDMFTITTWNSDLSSELQSFDGSTVTETGITQINTLFYDTATNKLYAGSNNWDAALTPPMLGYMMEFDVNTSTGALTHVENHYVGGYINEGCTKHDNSFWVVMHDDHAIHQYNTSWELVARHELPTSNPYELRSSTYEEWLWQGIFFDDDICYLVLHNENERSPRWDAYHWTGTHFLPILVDMPPPEAGAGQGVFYDGTDLWWSVRSAGFVGSVVKTTLSKRSMTVPTQAFAATAPEAFVDNDWSVATGASFGGVLDVTIDKQPENNGGVITDIEYELDASGTWVSSGSVSSFSITGLTLDASYDVRLRAVNSAGTASAGNTETASASGAAPAVPDAFVDANWSVATGSAGSSLDVTIASLPANNGAAITDVEYELDASGTWVSSGGTSSFTIGSLTASTSYDVRLRPVNSAGTGAAGNTETATSSTAGNFTAGYSANSIEPEFVADFAGNFYASSSAPDTFASIISTARTSTANYTNSSGILTEVSSNTGRKDHHVWDGSAYAREGLLVEAVEAVNSVGNQEDFSATFWTDNTGAATISSSAAVANPRNVSSAGLLTEDTSTGLHFVRSGAVDETSYSFGSRYTQSWFVKPNGRSRVTVYFPDSRFPSNRTAVFDLSTGTAIAPTDGISKIERFHNGWYRISYSHVCNSGGNGYAGLLALDNGSTVSYTGDGSSGVYVWGFSNVLVPAGASPFSSYHATTRTAEEVSAAAAKVPASTSAMSMQINAEIGYLDGNSAGQIRLLHREADASNLIAYQVDTDGADTGQIQFTQETAGTVDSVSSASGALTPGEGVTVAIAGRHTSSAINGAVSGTALTENSTPTALADLSSADLLLGDVGFVGTISKVVAWGDDIGDVGTEEAST